MRHLLLLFSLLLMLAPGPASAAQPQVEFTTNFGNFVVELYPDKAPRTVENFLEYVHDGFYHETLFHRVIDRFIVQGGSFRPDLSQKRSYDPIANEANNGLRNERGTLAMARAFKPDSAAAEFFINLNDNKTLNYYKPEPALMGYCVFGRVIRGMDVIDRIAKVPTRVEGQLTDLPRDNVIIHKAELLSTPVQPDQPAPVTAEGAQEKPAKPTKSSKKGKKRG